MSAAPSAPINMSQATDIQNYLTTFDLSQTTGCNLKENRFNIPNVKDSPTGQLYCWKGRIAFTSPGSQECDIGSICDVYSYANARTKFCLQWGGTGGCQPNLYVSNEGTTDAGTPVSNDRGGVIVYNSPTTCQGGVIGGISCVFSGFRQSFTNVLDPANRTNLILSGAIMFGLVILFVILARRYRKDLRKITKPKDVFK